MTLFYPFSSLSPPVWQERGKDGMDIRFKPTYVVFLSQIKLGLLVVETLFKTKVMAQIYVTASATFCTIFKLIINDVIRLSWFKFHIHGNFSIP